LIFLLLILCQWLIMKAINAPLHSRYRKRYIPLLSRSTIDVKQKGTFPLCRVCIPKMHFDDKIISCKLDLTLIMILWLWFQKQIWHKGSMYTSKFACHTLKWCKLWWSTCRSLRRQLKGASQNTQYIYIYRITVYCHT
jgi:hypothetical protein